MLDPMFTVTKEDQSDTYGKFIYEPLHPSFGNSVGNALRRTLLSSIQGAAISHVRFNKAAHLFDSLDGIKESILEIVLNLKKVRFQAEGEGPFHIKLSAKGEGKVYAKDIEGEVKVANGDLYLAHLTDSKAKLEMEGMVQIGYGYEPSDDKEEQTGYITLDTSFSPVTRVNFKVEEARVGRKTNYDRLILEVWTDGTITPEAAIKDSSMILSRQFRAVNEGRSISEEEEAEAKELSEEQLNPKAYETIIDELNLPSRVINALLRENIETVADLVERGKDDLTNLKGVGKKSIDLIQDELDKMDIELK